jgi:SEC-C motif-containing protein
MSRPCPCTSKLTFDKCCEPFLVGKGIPESAEKLMRSRFTAYALNRVDYLVDTTASEKRGELDVEDLSRYCRAVTCISLKILSRQAGGPQDDAGVVIFHASLQINGKRMLHRERSTFRREDGRWFYVDGETN